MTARGSPAANAGWSLVVDCHNLVGEGPWWDARTGTLLWVDIDGRLVQRYDPVAGQTTKRPLDRVAGAVVARRAGGLALAMDDGIWVTESDAGVARLLAPVEADDPRTRLNDAACDRSGRLWVGSMARDFRPLAGALYRVDPDGSVERVLDGTTISNGIDWSPDDRLMYYVDSALRRIDVLDYDVTTGRASGRRPLIEIAEEAGMPDGLTVDSEGCVWVAMWDGWSVRRYRPSGELDRIVRLPVSRVTSCAFGGADLADLFVTSASSGLSDAEREAQPLAGGLFAVRAGARGREATPFGG